MSSTGPPVSSIPVFATTISSPPNSLRAAFAAFAGSLLFPFQGLITPGSVGPLQSLQLLALVVIGGAGYRFGGFIGAFVITWLQALIERASSARSDMR